MTVTDMASDMDTVVMAGVAMAMVTLVDIGVVIGAARNVKYPLIINKALVCLL